MTVTHPPATWVSGILLAVFLTVASAATGPDAPTGSKKLNPAEQWVLEQVTAGEIADLASALNANKTKKFPNERERVLGARFVQDIITGRLPGVKPYLKGVIIRGATIEEEIDLRSVRVPWDVGLDNCQFKSEVRFARGDFEESITFWKSTFHAEANFYSVKVGNSVFCLGTVFKDKVQFSAADIAGNFRADDAQFQSEQHAADFGDMRVGHSAFFKKTIFEGEANFTSTDIGGQLVADEAEFRNTEEPVSFNGIKARDLFLNNTIFEGPVYAIGAVIGTNIQAEGVRFNDKKGVTFRGIKVGHSASFQKAIFEGPVDFYEADIADTFRAEEAEFRSKTQVARLEIKCARKGAFKGAAFSGRVSFADSSFLELVIGDTGVNAMPVPMIDLSRSSIKGLLSVKKIRIHNLTAQSLHVEGRADLTDLIVEHAADFSDSDFATLDLSRSVWPRDRENDEVFRMVGVNFKHIYADSGESKSHEALFTLAEQSAFSADVYGNLEAFFLRQAYVKDADRAFIAGKRRERKEALHRQEYLRWLGSGFLDLLVGYGRRPSQAGYFCAFFVGLGFVLFAPGKMELRRQEDARRTYNRFWYSLGLFLPFVNLETDKVWRPKAEQSFLRNYARVHSLAGWILILLVLVALTGLIK